MPLGWYCYCSQAVSRRSSTSSSTSLLIRLLLLSLPKFHAVICVSATFCCSLIQSVQTLVGFPLSGLPSFLFLRFSLANSLLPFVLRLYFYYIVNCFINAEYVCELRLYYSGSYYFCVVERSCCHATFTKPHDQKHFAINFSFFLSFFCSGCENLTIF